MTVIRYDGTPHTARLIGDHHNFAGLWETSVLPGYGLTREDADFVICILARFMATPGRVVALLEGLARPSVLDFAERNGIAVQRLADNLDGRPGTFYITGDGPGDNPTVYTWHLQRDIYDHDRPAYVVGTQVWTGGWREVRRHPWHVDGLAAMGQWAMEHHAANRNSGCPPRTADELLAHAEVPLGWQLDRDHRGSAPIVACDSSMQITYQIDCSCGQFSSGWRHTDQLARRELTEHRDQQLGDQARAELRSQITHARRVLAERYPVTV
jgi:hypothetical protein